MAPRPWTPVLRVDLALPEVPEGVNRGPELVGLLTVLVELGLCDLPGVVALVAGAPPPPGQGRTLGFQETRWTGGLEVRAVEDAVTLDLTLCDPAQACSTWSESGSRALPQEIVAPLLGEAAVHLGREPGQLVRERWGLPVSKDDYAVLLTGRAAATAYGQHPAASPALVGHKRQDPVTRAAFVDPFAAPAAWVVSRRDADLGELNRALDVLPRAQAARPESVQLAADEAAILAALGRDEPARRSWQAVRLRAPGDARYVLPLAEAELATGSPDVAGDILDTLPRGAEGHPDVVALRVAIADAGGEAEDELLARWQEAAPEDPEPVRRRLALRAREQAWAEAMELAEELGRRGAVDEARRLELPLALALGDPARAEEAARALGREDTASRIARARAHGAGPTSCPTKGEADRVTRRACAASALQAGELELARATLAAVLAEAPWDPDALALLLAAQRRAGETDAAGLTRSRLAQADPDHPAL